MAAINKEHLMRDHHSHVDGLKSIVEETQADHVALNTMMSSLDFFDRFSSFSNLMCRFLFMGVGSTGVTLASVHGGAFVWLTVGLLGSTLATIGSLTQHENRKKELDAA